MSWFDDALSRIAPKMAFERARYRMAAAYYRAQLRKYEAGTKGRRTAGWKTSSTSANAETAMGLGLVRDRARDLDRNNGWGTRPINVVAANVVGTGIRAQPKHPTSDQKTETAKRLWANWAETTACDWNGELNFYALQEMVMKTIVRDGEAIVIFRRVAITAPDVVPLKLQVLEADHLDMHLTKGQDGNQVIQGIEVDAEGRPVAAWVYPVHPGEAGAWNIKSNRIPIEQVARPYRKDRPGQLRGVSWLAPVIITLRDLDEYDDAQLVRQKIAACFTVFVSDANGGSDDALPGDPNAAPNADRVEPGMIVDLAPGKDIKMATPPSVEGFGEFERAQLRKVASAIGITYEALTQDLSQTNFSGGRMGWLEMHRNVDKWRWLMFIPMFCEPVWAQFVMAASVSSRRNNITGTVAEWTPPRRELINPKDDVLAIQMMLRNGQKSWSESVREQGYDPDQVLAEIASDIKKFDKLGLMFDCDPRKLTFQGQAQPDAAGDTTPPP